MRDELSCNTMQLINILKHEKDFVLLVNKTFTLGVIVFKLFFFQYYFLDILFEIINCPLLLIF